jgi:phage terminase large subunit
MKSVRFEDYAGFQDRQLVAWNELKKPTNKYLLYGGAAGGGKSYFLRWAAFGLGLFYFWKYDIRDFTIGLFCEDYPTLKDRQITKIKKEFPPELGHLIESRDEGYLFQASPEYGGFKIFLRNLDDPAKYASVEFAGVFVDELTKNPLETFEDLRFRMRYPGIPIPKFVAGSNPGSVGHGWVKKLWIEPDPKNMDKEQDNFVYIPSLAKDNKYIDPSYVLQLEALPEAKRKAFLEGSWDIFAGQVFTEWHRNTHVVKPFNIPKEWNIYGAIDLGWNKPMAIGWYAQSPDDRTYLINELYGNADWFEMKFGKQLTLTRLTKVINAMSRKMGVHVNYWVGDPAMWNRIIREGEIKKGQDVEGESYAEIMISAGLHLIAGDNNRANGLARYREMLSIASDGLPYYQVFEGCYDTIRTIPSLVYSQQTTKMEDVETDSEDHCYDRDRYLFMSRPSPIPNEIKKPKSQIERYKNYLKTRSQEGEF